MNRILLLIPAVSIIITLNSSAVFSQNKPVSKEPRNNWSMGLSYSERGFGPSFSYYFPSGKSTDFFLNFSVSGVTDSREFERTDYYGNTIPVENKINRVYMSTLSFGLRKELFKDDIEGEFLPIFNIGVSPSMIFMNPYNQNFFSAIGSTTTSFGIGGFTGLGVSFRQSKDMSINFNLSYYYIKVVGNEVESIKDNPIDNIGGVQLGFAINFMR